MDRTKVRNPSGNTTRRVWHTRYRDLEVGPGDETVGLRTGRDITPPASIADAPARSGAATGIVSFSPSYLGSAESACRQSLTTA